MESIEEDDDIEDNDVTNSDFYNEKSTIVTFPNDIDLSNLMSCLTLEEELVKKKTVPIDSNIIFNKSFLSTKVE